MIYVSEDIVLAPLSEDSIEDVFLTIDQNRESLRVWLPFVDATKSIEDTIRFVQSVLISQEKVFEIRLKNKFVGLIGLKELDDTNKKVEIGYWMNPVVEGRGIMTLSVQKMLDYSFNILQLNRVLIQVAIDNKKSRRIPERLGFKEEGLERDGELLVSGYTDIVRYGLLKREYNGNY